MVVEEYPKHFKGLEALMRAEFLTLDQPPTLTGRLVTIYSVYRVTCALVLFAVASTQLCFYGEAYLLSGKADLLALGILTVYVVTSTLMNYKNVRETANDFQRIIDNFTDPWEKEKIDAAIDKAGKTGALVVKICSAFNTAILVSQTFVMSCHYFTGLPEKPLAMTLLFENFLEGNYELTTKFLVFVFLSLIYGFQIGSAGCYFAVNEYYMVTTAVIMDTLVKNVEHIKSTADDGGSEAIGRDIDLNSLIEKHANLLEVVRKMMLWNSAPALIVNVGNCVYLCLCAMSIQQNLRNGLYAAVVIYGTFIVFMVGLIFIYDNHGQKIEAKSEELKEAVYDLPWYRLPVKNRRTVLIMLTQLSKPMEINSYGICKLNLATAYEIIKTSYTYFMVLNSIDSA